MEPSILAYFLSPYVFSSSCETTEKQSIVDKDSGKCPPGMIQNEDCCILKDERIMKTINVLHTYRIKLETLPFFKTVYDWRLSPSDCYKETSFIDEKTMSLLSLEFCDQIF